VTIKASINRKLQPPINAAANERRSSWTVFASVWIKGGRCRTIKSSAVRVTEVPYFKIFSPQHRNMMELMQSSVTYCKTKCHHPKAPRQAGAAQTSCLFLFQIQSLLTQNRQQNRSKRKLFGLKRLATESVGAKQ
jgi:hypothetical protein